MRFIIKDPHFPRTRLEFEIKENEIDVYEYQNENYVRYWEYVRYNNRGIQLTTWMFNSKVKLLISPVCFDFPEWKNFVKNQ